MGRLPSHPDGSSEPETPFPLAAIEAAIRGIRYGEVTIIIQDGRVVQIEKTEKVRLDSIRSRGRSFGHGDGI